MKLITSSDNPTYKSLTQLKLKKNRDKLKKYIIEGPNLITEALANGGEIDSIIFRHGCKPVDCEAPAIALEERLFDKLCDTETPQGVLAVVRMKHDQEDEFFDSGKREGTNIILLDRLQDPGNIGTILRTADAAGYMGAIIMKGTGDIYSPKVVRAAAGSLFRLPVLFCDTPDEAICLLKRHNKSILCTALRQSRDYYSCRMKEDIALIIGNEGNGVCEEFLIKSDILVKIPMYGNIESLNAAVSAGILMYESVRQKLQM